MRQYSGFQRSMLRLGSAFSLGELLVCSSLISACTTETVKVTANTSALKTSRLKSAAAQAGSTPTPTRTPGSSYRDVLFVADNSASSKGMLKQFSEDVESFLGEIPSGLRFAVMSSMAGKPENLSEVHPTHSLGFIGSAALYVGAAAEPGFLSLVSSQSLSRFLAQTELVAQNPAAEESYRRSYPIDLCADAWFAPGQKNGKGELCLKAALQSPGHPLSCEPALLAVSQFFSLQKAQGQKTFRTSVEVDIVVLSDEPHPGCDAAEILSNVPAASALSDLGRQLGAGDIRIHGVGVDPLESSLPVAAGPLYGSYEVSVRKRANESGGRYVSLFESTSRREELKRLIVGE